MNISAPTALCVVVALTSIQRPHIPVIRAVYFSEAVPFGASGRHCRTVSVSLSSALIRSQCVGVGQVQELRTAARIAQTHLYFFFFFFSLIVIDNLVPLYVPAASFDFAV